MAGELIADPDVIGRLVGHQAAFLGKVRVDDRLDVGGIRLIDHEAAHIAAALDKGQSCLLVGIAASALRLHFSVLLADEGLISFANRTFAAHRSRKAACPHRFTDTMAHEPCGLKSDFQRPMQLV